jgi:predicted acetyltransferase
VPPEPGRVHLTYRWFVEDDTYLKPVDRRHELNNFLLEAGGYIGYSARRRSLTTWALARTLDPPDHRL